MDPLCYVLIFSTAFLSSLAIGLGYLCLRERELRKQETGDLKSEVRFFKRGWEKEAEKTAEGWANYQGEVFKAENMKKLMDLL